MKKTLFVSFVALLVTACTSESKYKESATFTWDDIKQSQQLKGEEVKFDNPVMKPIRIGVQDSLLFTIDAAEDTIFSVYSLHRGTFVGKRIQRGQGPNDMLQPSFVQINKKEISLFDMATSSISFYGLSDFVSTDGASCSRKIQLSDQVFGDVCYLDDQILTAAYGKDQPFYLFDHQGGGKKAWGAYPVLNGDYTNLVNSEAFQSTFTTNGKDRVAVCHSWTDLIELYDKSGRLIKRLHGPEGFLPYFKEVAADQGKMAHPEQGKQRDAYYNPVSVGDRFFVLFNGGYVDAKDYSTLSTRLLVFTWEGELSEVFHLDQGVFTYTVDPHSKTIYGISDSPEFHIVKFSYQ